jgi:hypothetical protein
MLAQWMWSAAFAVLLCLLLSLIFPGHRAESLAQMNAAAQCREVERALLQHRDAADDRLMPACRPPL